MKKMMLCVGLVCGLLIAGGAQAMNADEALEKLMLLNFAQEVDLSEYQLLELLGGFAEYRAQVDALAEKAAELNKKLAEAKSISDVSSTANALIDLQKQKLSILQMAVSQASDVLDAEAYAKFCALVTNLDASKAQMRMMLSMPCGMASSVCGAAPVAAAAEEDPKALVMAGIQQWMDSLKKQDIDGMMKMVSDKFEHYEFGDKDGLRDFLQQAMDMGYLDGVDVDASDVEVEIEGNEATVYPIEVIGAFGSITLEFIATKEGSEWKVTGMDAAGI